MAVVLEFLDALTGPLDTTCFEDDELEFLSSGADEVALESVTYRIEDFGVEISTVRPVDWSVGSLQGDQYRRRSFLDSTELYQLAGNPALSEVLAEFVEDEQGVTLSSSERFTDDESLPFDSDELPGLWDRRSGRSGSAVVEWFESFTDDQVVLVVLVSSAAELDGHLESVLLPALQAIDVRSL